MEKRWPGFDKRLRSPNFCNENVPPSPRHGRNKWGSIDRSGVASLWMDGRLDKKKKKKNTRGGKRGETAAGTWPVESGVTRLVAPPFRSQTTSLHKYTPRLHHFQGWRTPLNQIMDVIIFHKVIWIFLLALGKSPLEVYRPPPRYIFAYTMKFPICYRIWKCDKTGEWTNYYLLTFKRSVCS